MADKDKMSVEEILAAARRQDSAAGSESSESEPAPSPKEPQAKQPQEAADAPSTEPASSEPGDKPAPKPAKKAGAMSVEEMLAAARAEKEGAAQPEKAGGEAASSESAAESGSDEPAPAGPQKKPGAMSVEEMLAAARGEKTKPAAKAKPPAAAAKAKPQAAAPAPAAKKPAAPVAGGPKDTASILAAARKPARPGPISKAEAAAQAKAAETPSAETKPAAKPKPTVPPMPERPAYARRPEPAAARRPPAERETRRGFFAAMTGVLFGSSLALGFTSLALTHLLWLLGLARFMFPNVLTEPPTRFKVGFPDAYAPGQVETKFKAQFGVWVVRYEYEGEQQIYALKSVCTHLGCTPNWLEGEQKFKCPCHGSGFYKDGVNFEGPAPRPLERYAIQLADDGQLEVDKSATFQQEMEQWSDPSSYYAV